MKDRHGVTVAQALQALHDPRAVQFTPDYNSKSGDSIRVVGWSNSANSLLSIILVVGDDGLYGATGWRSNERDKRYYEGGERNE